MGHYYILKDGEHPDMYMVPASSWNNKESKLRVYHSYEGKKYAPATLPFTGGTSLGISMASATTIALTADLTVSAIILASFFGVAMLIALFKDYKFEYKKDGMKATFKKN